MGKYLILIFIFISQTLVCQIELNPNSITELKLSLEGEKAFNDNVEKCLKIYDRMDKEGLKFDDLSQIEQDALSNFDETEESYWGIGGGCSWYCGGGPKEVTASSYLKSQGETSYNPENAHDLNFKNVWVEGKEDLGIVEYLLYIFNAQSPRINEISIVNGYVKSKKAWEDNSRVKKLKMYLDDIPYAILNLEDIRGIQSFKVEPIGNGNRQEYASLKDKPDWTIKFEILEAYQGLKYDDVVISEIYFDGLDVHCFAAGTKIKMSDNTSKNIENLKIGDSVNYLDLQSGKIQSAVVEGLESAIHRNLVVYKFKSGKEIIATQEHPFYIRNKGWASLKPDKSKQYLGFEQIQIIEIQDNFESADGKDQLVEIVELDGEQKTYTISKLSSGNNFIANGFIVGVEELNINIDLVVKQKSVK